MLLAYWVTVSAISLVIPVSTLHLYCCFIVVFVEQNKLIDWLIASYSRRPFCAVIAVKFYLLHASRIPCRVWCRTPSTSSSGRPCSACIVHIVIAYLARVARKRLSLAGACHSCARRVPTILVVQRVEKLQCRRCCKCQELPCWV